MQRNGTRYSDDRYRMLFENSGEPILIIEGDRFVDCNQAAVDMLGYADKSALLQCHPSEISPEYQPDGQLSVDKANSILARSRETPYQCFEWTHVRADGTLFPVEVALTSIPGERGFTLHTTWRDISERKRLETELRHAQKMDAVGRLAGGIAHDFNNQLVPILGFAEMLVDALRHDPKHADWAAEIHRAATIAAAMVNKLLSVSRKHEHGMIVVDVDEAVTDLAGMLSKLIGEDITLDIRPAGESLWVEMVSGDIEQIIMNLTSNARDALPDGGTIAVGLSRVRKSGENLARLEFSDDGCGMDADTLAHIYEPFFTTKEIGSGTGLGMSTVLSMVGNAGGRIDASSKPGGGTTIVIDLPLTDAPAPRRAVAGDDRGSTALNGAEQPHVLVVEDNTQIALFVSQVLRENGFHVSAALNGQDALNLMQDESPDLILTDVIMDKLSGPLMVKRLREDGVATPVVFMSGHTDDRITAAGLDIAQFPLLRKPFTAASLLSRIRDSLAAAAS